MTDRVPTVSLFDISSPGPPDRVLAEWRGFIEFRPGELSDPGRPVLLLDHSPALAWKWIPGLAPM